MSVKFLVVDLDDPDCREKILEVSSEDSAKDRVPTGALSVMMRTGISVSYTHLTLPTILLV